MIYSTFYLSHGPPTASIDDSLPARHFFKSWKEKVLPERPRAILVVSGPWETHEPTVNVVQRNDTIYDFSGFPECLHQVIRNDMQNHIPPGAPELAKRVKELLQAAGIKRVNEDTKRGLDHATWVPLMLMYPEADIPVCELSVQTKQDATYHYNIGKALAPLKAEGVLILGSGSATHNLQIIGSKDQLVASRISKFDTWLKDALLEGRYGDVNEYEEEAPHANLAHPKPDHLYPLHVAMGAAGADSKAKLIHHSWGDATLSLASYQFTTPIGQMIGLISESRFLV